MQNIYIVRTKDCKLHCFYYTNESGVNLRTYEHNKWGKALNIVPDASENYTLTLSEDGVFYIFCSDSAGNTHLCKNDPDKNTWNTELILRNQSPIINAVIFSPIITKDGLKLISNVPSPEDRTHFIMTQQLYKNGEWGTPSRLDRITPFLNNIFVTQAITNDHLLLFYQTKTPETNLGYREITSDRAGSFNIFHSTIYQIMDTAFLTATDSIHVLYVVKSMFSTQLVYRKRDSSGFSNAVTIWEGQRIENCSMYFINGILHASFISSGYLYISQSEDYGLNFSRPVRYKNSFCKNPVKAIYISETEMNEKHYFTREVYVDKHSPFDIQILPGLIENFYPTENEQPLPPPAVYEKQQEQPLVNGYIYTDHYDPFANMSAFFEPKVNERNKSLSKGVSIASYDPFSQLPDSYSTLNNAEPRASNAGFDSLDMLKRSLQASLEQNASKDRQLSNLTNIISRKNKEKKVIEREYERIHKAFQDQINKNEKLKQDLSTAISRAETQLNIRTQENMELSKAELDGSKSDDTELDEIELDDVELNNTEFDSTELGNTELEDTESDDTGLDDMASNKK